MINKEVVMSTKLQREHDANLRQVTSALAKQARIDRQRKQLKSRESPYTSPLHGKEPLENDDDIVLSGFQNFQGLNQGFLDAKGIVGPKTFEIRISSRERSSRASCANVGQRVDLMAFEGSPSSEKSETNIPAPRVPRLNVRTKDNQGRGTSQGSNGSHQDGLSLLRLQKVTGSRRKCHLSHFSTGPQASGFSVSKDHKNNMDLKDLGLKKIDTLYVGSGGQVLGPLKGSQLGSTYGQGDRRRSTIVRQGRNAMKGKIVAQQLREEEIKDAGNKQEPLVQHILTEQHGLLIDKTASGRDARTPPREIDTQRRPDAESESVPAGSSSRPKRKESQENFSLIANTSPDPQRLTDTSEYQRQQSSLEKQACQEVAQIFAKQSTLNPQQNQDDYVDDQRRIKSEVHPQEQVPNKQTPMQQQIKDGGQTEATSVRPVSPQTVSQLAAPSFAATSQLLMYIQPGESSDQAGHSIMTTGPPINHQLSKQQATFDDDEYVFQKKPTLMLDHNNIIYYKVQPNTQQRSYMQTIQTQPNQSVVEASENASLLPESQIQLTNEINVHTQNIGSGPRHGQRGQTTPPRVTSYRSSVKGSQSQIAERNKPRNFHIVVNQMDIKGNPSPIEKIYLVSQSIESSQRTNRVQKNDTESVSQLKNTLSKQIDNNMFITSIRRSKKTETVDQGTGFSGQKLKEKPESPNEAQRTVALVSSSSPRKVIQLSKPKAGAIVNQHTMMNNIKKRHILNEINKRGRRQNQLDDDNLSGQGGRSGVVSSDGSRYNSPQNKGQMISGSYQPAVTHTAFEPASEQRGSEPQQQRSNMKGEKMEQAFAQFEQFRPQRVLDLNRQIDLKMSYGEHHKGVDSVNRNRQAMAHKEVRKEFASCNRSPRQPMSKRLNLSKLRKLKQLQKQAQQIGQNINKIIGTNRDDIESPGLSDDLKIESSRVKGTVHGHVTPKGKITPVKILNADRGIEDIMNDQLSGTSGGRIEQDLLSMEQAYRHFFVDNGGDKGQQNINVDSNLITENQAVTENQGIENGIQEDRGRQTLTNSELKREMKDFGSMESVNKPHNFDMKVLRKPNRSGLSPPASTQSPRSTHRKLPQSSNDPQQESIKALDFQKMTQSTVPNPSLFANGIKNVHRLSPFGSLGEWTQPDVATPRASPIQDLTTDNHASLAQPHQVHTTDPSISNDIQTQINEQNRAIGVILQPEKLLTIPSPDYNHNGNKVTVDKYKHNDLVVDSRKVQQLVVDPTALTPNKAMGNSLVLQRQIPMRNTIDTIQPQRKGSTQSQGLSIASQCNAGSPMTPRMGQQGPTQTVLASTFQDNRQSARRSSDPVVHASISVEPNTDLQNNGIDDNIPNKIHQPMLTQDFRRPESYNVSLQDNLNRTGLAQNASSPNQKDQLCSIKQQVDALSKLDLPFKTQVRNQSPRLALSGPIHAHGVNVKKAQISPISNGSRGLNKDIQLVIGSYNEEHRSDMQASEQLPIYMKAHEQHCTAAQRQLLIKKMDLTNTQKKQEQGHQIIGITKNEEIVNQNQKPQIISIVCQQNDIQEVNKQTDPTQKVTDATFGDDTRALHILKDSTEFLPNQRLIEEPPEMASEENSPQLVMSGNGNKHQRALESNVLSTNLGSNKSAALGQGDQDKVIQDREQIDQINKQLQLNGNIQENDPGKLTSLPGYIGSDQTIHRPTKQGQIDTQSLHQSTFDNNQEKQTTQNNRKEIQARPVLSAREINRRQDGKTSLIGATEQQLSQVQPQITVKIEVSQEKNHLGMPSNQQVIQEDDLASHLEQSKRRRDVQLVTIIREKKQLDAMTSPRQGEQHLQRSEESVTTSSMGPVGMEHKHVYLEVANTETRQEESQQKIKMVDGKWQDDDQFKLNEMKKNQPLVVYPKASHRQKFSTAISTQVSDSLSRKRDQIEKEGMANKQRRKACIPQPFIRQSIQQRESIIQGATQMIQIKPQQLNKVRRSTNDKKQFLDQLPVLIKKRQEEQIQYLQNLENSQNETNLKQLFERFVDQEQAGADWDKKANQSMDNAADCSIGKGTVSSCTQQRERGFMVTVDHVQGSIYKRNNRYDDQRPAPRNLTSIGMIKDKYNPIKTNHGGHKRGILGKSVPNGDLDQLLRERRIQSQGDPTAQASKRNRTSARGTQVCIKSPSKVNTSTINTKRAPIYSHRNETLLNEEPEERNIRLQPIRQSFAAPATIDASVTFGQSLGGQDGKVSVRRSIQTTLGTSRLLPHDGKVRLGPSALAQQTRELHRAYKNQNNYHGQYIRPQNLLNGFDGNVNAQHRRGKSEAERLRPIGPTSQRKAQQFNKNWNKTVVVSPRRPPTLRVGKSHSRAPSSLAPMTTTGMDTGLAAFFANQTITDELKPMVMDVTFNGKGLAKHFPGKLDLNQLYKQQINIQRAIAQQITRDKVVTTQSIMKTPGDRRSLNETEQMRTEQLVEDPLLLSGADSGIDGNNDGSVFSDPAMRPGSRTRVNIGTASLTDDYNISEQKDPGILQSLQNGGLILGSPCTRQVPPLDGLGRLRTAAEGSRAVMMRNKLENLPEENPFGPPQFVTSFDTDGNERPAQRTGVPGHRFAKTPLLSNHEVNDY